MERKNGLRLNIGIIHPDLGIGGAERLIVDAAVELASHGHNVHIFTAHHDKNRCFEETLSGLCSYPTDEVKKVFKGCILLPLSRFVVGSTYNFSEEDISEANRLRRRSNNSTGMADLILVNSKFTATTFAKTFKHLDSQAVRPAVLYPAVNLEQFTKPDAFKLNFLSINRFERKKNIDLAISAFSMLCKDDTNVLQGHNLADATLTVAGGFDRRLRENVEYLEELKALADREGVSDRVKFVTSCSTSERNTFLSECLCVLYTPKDEHFGIVPLEAMAAHKPVVACNSGGPVETIKDSITGFLCDPNPEAFSLAMSKFIREPQLAEIMGNEARRHVEESFSTKIFGQNLNRYLVDIVREKIE